MPRIAKFLAHHYPGGVTLLPTDQKLFQLWGIAQTEKVKMRSYGRTPRPLSALVTLTVGQCHKTRRAVLLNDAELKAVNTVLDLYLYEEFFAEVRCQQSRGNRNAVITAIRVFTDRYDFSEDDIAETTLRMAWYRACQTGRIGFDDAALTSTPFASLLSFDSSFGLLAA